MQLFLIKINNGRNYDDYRHESFLVVAEDDTDAKQVLKNETLISTKWYGEPFVIEEIQEINTVNGYSIAVEK